MKYTIANDKEWQLAQSILAKEKAKGDIYSGFKIDPKRHRGLMHAFIYFSNAQGKEMLVALGKKHYLGSGAEALVKLVEDENGHLYVVKKISMEYRYVDPHRLPSDIEILSRLGIENAYGKSKKWHYFLEPFRPGLMLFAFLDQCPSLTEDQQCALVYHLAIALKGFHDNDILHGDISSKNFLVNSEQDKSAQVFLIDIGNSYAIDKNKKSDKDSINSETKDLISLMNHFFNYQWSDKHLSSISNLDQIVQELEKYKDIPLPVADTIKKLQSNYQDTLDHQESLNTLKEGEDNAFMNDYMKQMVKLTNDISQLNALFNYVKATEQRQPYLHKQTETYIASLATWKKTIAIFKTRALQIAEDRVHLGLPIDHPEQYYNILAENNLGFIISPFNPLVRFESVLNRHKAQDFNVDAYERAKLIKYFENYIERIESYKPKNDKNINFQHGFWFDPSNRGINRKANYKMACAIRDELRDLHRPLADIFNDEHLTQLRQKENPTRSINSVELLRAITYGKELTQKELRQVNIRKKSSSG